MKRRTIVRTKCVVVRVMEYVLALRQIDIREHGAEIVVVVMIMMVLAKKIRLILMIFQKYLQLFP